MQELLRTNDIVVFTFAQALLAEAGIAALTADETISIMEGSIGIFPRRLMVLGGDWSVARKVLAEGGLAEWLLD